MPGRVVPRSNLLGGSWNVDGLGLVMLVVPSRTAITRIDQVWPGERLPADVHRHWRWADIVKNRTERFALVDGAGSAVSIWATSKKGVQLEGKRLYRLDYLEVRPTLRGGLAGAFSLALAGTRAAELGSEGLVLAAFPEVAGFYVKYGGVQRAVEGWNVAPDLLPVIFDDSALSRFREVVSDAARKEDDQ